MFKVRKGYYFYTHPNPKNGEILTEGQIIDPADYQGKKAKLIQTQLQKLVKEDGTAVTMADAPTVKPQKQDGALSTASVSGKLKEEPKEAPKEEPKEEAKEEPKEEEKKPEKKAKKKAPENKQVGEAPETKGLSATQEQ